MNCIILVHTTLQSSVWQDSSLGAAGGWYTRWLPRLLLIPSTNLPGDGVIQWSPGASARISSESRNIMPTRRVFK